jgi:hypothetical protein
VPDGSRKEIPTGRPMDSRRPGRNLCSFAPESPLEKKLSFGFVSVDSDLNADCLGHPQQSTIVGPSGTLLPCCVPLTQPLTPQSVSCSACPVSTYWPDFTLGLSNVVPFHFSAGAPCIVKGVVSDYAGMRLGCPVSPDLNPTKGWGALEGSRAQPGAHHWLAEKHSGFSQPSQGHPGPSMLQGAG